MSKRSNHVISTGKNWAVKKSGALRASKVFGVKKDAVEYGRGISKKEKTELYIHKMDGRIQDKNSYGKDPFPPKG